MFSPGKREASHPLVQWSSMQQAPVAALSWGPVPSDAWHLQFWPAKTLDFVSGDRRIWPRSHQVTYLAAIERTKTGRVSFMVRDWEYTPEYCWENDIAQWSSHGALPLYIFSQLKLLSNLIREIRGLLQLIFQIGYLVLVMAIIPEGCV